MKVLVNPADDERGSGTTSHASWDNAYMEPAMKVLFGIGQHERIAQIEVDGNGITARIEKSATPPASLEQP